MSAQYEMINVVGSSFITVSKIFKKYNIHDTQVVRESPVSFMIDF